MDGANSNTKWKVAVPNCLMMAVAISVSPNRILSIMYSRPTVQRALAQMCLLPRWAQSVLEVASSMTTG